ncbi:MAG: hypothetical protein R2807_10150 [Chitinophagales bacterium]
MKLYITNPIIYYTKYILDIRLFKTNDEALFYVCFDLVSANKSVIAAAELKICTVILINYCIHKINNKSKPLLPTFLIYINS